MAKGTVKARWVAGYPASLPDGTQLEPNKTVVNLPEAEARGSDNWEIVTKGKAPKDAGGED